MLTINTNLSSIITQSSLTKATTGLNQAIERMSTGFKINHAKDNAANYSISTNLSTKISAYQVAEDNASMGLDMVTTASETLTQIENKLSRLRALQEQASNGTYGKQSLKAINKEANALVDEIQRLYNSAEYNGIDLFQEKTTDPSMPVAQYDGFIEKVEKQTPDVVVSDPTKLADAIANNNVIGISNAETLAQLATLVNSGTTCSGKTIILTNDIDLADWCADHIDENGEGGWVPIGKNSTYSFKGTFNGNGHEISNVYINRSTEDCQGLFGAVVHAEIKNVGVINVDIKANASVGGLVAYNYTSSITNTYTTGIVTGLGRYIGGSVGESRNSSTIDNSYSLVDVTGYKGRVGGLVGQLYSTSRVNNSYAKGNVTGYDNFTGGLAGIIEASSSIDNSYSSGNVISYGSYTGGFVGYSSCIINNSCTTSKVMGNSVTGAFAGQIIFGTDRTMSNNTYYSSINEGLAGVGNNASITSDMLLDKVAPSENMTNLQVGINAGDSSSIGLVTAFELRNIDILRGIGFNSNIDYLSMIDEYLGIISAKQTEYGAAQNRLTSALEEISIQYQNLVSSRSTIRDADIAEVSSQYIQKQILQQASATLLATANQTPAIAMQLI